MRKSVRKIRIEKINLSSGQTVCLRVGMKKKEKKTNKERGNQNESLREFVCACVCSCDFSRKIIDRCLRCVYVQKQRNAKGGKGTVTTVRQNSVTVVILKAENSGIK